MVAAYRRLARDPLPRLPGEEGTRRRHHAAARGQGAVRGDARPRPDHHTEVGQHQMWAAQHFGFSAPNRWLTSGGLGTMGYGFPAAVGAQVARPDRLVICIAGEASLQMNIQEMGTVAQYRLPVKIFILNNERSEEHTSELQSLMRI